MHLILYTTVAEDIQRHIDDILRRFVAPERIEVYRSAPALEERLKHPIDEETLVLLAPGRTEDLQEIFGLRRFLEQLRTVLLAPDQEPATIAQAHQLRPRYLGDAREIGEMLAAVLEKMWNG